MAGALCISCSRVGDQVGKLIKQYRGQARVLMWRKYGGIKRKTTPAIPSRSSLNVEKTRRESII
jgi:hypothetical protein